MKDFAELREALAACSHPEVAGVRFYRDSDMVCEADGDDCIAHCASTERIGRYSAASLIVAALNAAPALLAALDEARAQRDEAVKQRHAWERHAEKDRAEVATCLHALELAQEAMSDMGLQRSYSFAWDAVCTALAGKETP